jgi:hypothetical protein
MGRVRRKKLEDNAETQRARGAQRTAREIWRAAAGLGGLIEVNRVGKNLKAVPQALKRRGS